MKKSELKDYNRPLRAENEALKYLLQEDENMLSGYCRCGEIKLLQEENNELVKDLNDLQYEWAKDHTYQISEMKHQEVNLNFADMTLQEFERDIESLTAERDQYRDAVRELKKEKYDMGMELERLKKQLDDAMGSQR